MTWTADHTPGTTTGNELVEPSTLSTPKAAVSVPSLGPVPAMHRSHRVHNGVCLDCGAYDSRLYTTCQGRMAMD